MKKHKFLIPVLIVEAMFAVFYVGNILIALINLCAGTNWTLLEGMNVSLFETKMNLTVELVDAMDHWLVHIGRLLCIHHLETCGLLLLLQVLEGAPSYGSNRLYLIGPLSGLLHISFCTYYLLNVVSLLTQIKLRAFTCIEISYHMDLSSRNRISRGLNKTI